MAHLKRETLDELLKKPEVGQKRAYEDFIRPAVSISSFLIVCCVTGFNHKIIFGGPLFAMCLQVVSKKFGHFNDADLKKNTGLRIVYPKKENDFKGIWGK